MPLCVVGIFDFITRALNPQNAPPWPNLLPLVAVISIPILLIWAVAELIEGAVYKTRMRKERGMNVHYSESTKGSGANAADILAVGLAGDEMVQNESTAMQRLGHVLGWAGNLVGVPLVLVGVYTLTLPGGATDAKVLFLLLPGIVIFLLGRAFRYVLAG